MTEANEIGKSETTPEFSRRRWHERPYAGPPAAAVAPSQMSDIETVIRFSKWVEHALQIRYGATGKGLREKADSVVDQLPPDVHAHLAFLGTVRNSLAHDHGEDRVRNPTQYNQTRDALIAFFRPPQPPSPPLPEPIGWSVVWRLLRRLGIAPSNLDRKLRPVRRVLSSLAFVSVLVVFVFARGPIPEPLSASLTSIPSTPLVDPAVVGVSMAMLALLAAGMAAGAVLFVLSRQIVDLVIALVDIALVMTTVTIAAWLLWQLRLLVS